MVEVGVADAAAQDLDAANLDDAVAVFGVKPGRLGIQDDLPQRDSLSIPASGNSFICESVCPLVLGMAGVALHPVPFYLVTRRCPVELAPEVLVFHRLLVRGAPAAALPARDPLRDALHHVERVGVEPHLARTLQGVERPDRRGELHPVVRGLGFAPPQLFLGPLGAQQRAPPAGTGVAAARAVAVDLDNFIGHASFGHDHWFSEGPATGPDAAPAPAARWA